MGLDMYAYATDEPVTGQIDFSTDDHACLHDWRKHPNLHGWMENLYREKGGEAESFNCVSVELTATDIDRLEGDIKAKCLPHTVGFFFGASDGTEIDDDLEFIRKARDALAEGLTVYYSSWW